MNGLDLRLIPQDVTLLLGFSLLFTLLIPAAFQIVNPILLPEAVGIQNQPDCRMEKGLIQVRPEGKLMVSISWSHGFKGVRRGA